MKIKDLIKKLKEIDVRGVTTIKLNRPFSMNMGIYSSNIIQQFKPFLMTKKCTKEEDCMKFKEQGTEDYIFNHDPNNRILHNYNGWKYTGPTDYYRTGTMRIVEHYPNLDIYKIKANWGQGIWTLQT